MKQSNTGINHTNKAAFTHNDGIYEKLEDSVCYLGDEE